MRLATTNGPTADTRRVAAELRLARRAYRSAIAKCAAKPTSAKRARKLQEHRARLAEALAASQAHAAGSSDTTLTATRR